MIMKRITAILTLLTAAVPAPGEIVSYEASLFPEDVGWTRSFFCTPERWLADGWFHQKVEPAECFDPPSGDRDTYSRSIQDFVGVVNFFVEWRVEAMGDSSEIPWGGPAIMSAHSQAFIAYWWAIAADQVKFVRDAFAVILIVDIQPGVPHTYRLAQYGEEQYLWYIDGQVVHSDVPGGAYPQSNPAIAWRAKSAFLESEVRWDYIRYGGIPIDGSFDYNGDADVDAGDYYFVEDCLTKDGPGIFGGPNNDAGPGCRFADSDADGDVDLRDIAAMQNAFAGDGE